MLDRKHLSMHKSGSEPIVGKVNEMARNIVELSCGRVCKGLARAIHVGENA